MIRLGITGTDTGVGKTTVTTALIALLRRQGLRVAPMKPVETGVVAGDPVSDAVRLRRAAGSDAPLDDICPVVYAEPLAPWVAGARTGHVPSLELLDVARERLARTGDVLIVEGAGGLLVPITRCETYRSLFARWGLDVIVVAANRLGVINHTLLTVHAVRDAGLSLRGVVLNDATPPDGTVARATNLDTLGALLDGIPLVSFPWLGDADDPELLADAADACGLSALTEVAPAR